MAHHMHYTVTISTFCFNNNNNSNEDIIIWNNPDDQISKKAVWMNQKSNQTLDLRRGRKRWNERGIDRMVESEPIIVDGIRFRKYSKIVVQKAIQMFCMLCSSYSPYNTQTLFHMCFISAGDSMCTFTVCMFKQESRLYAFETVHICW